MSEFKLLTISQTKYLSVKHKLEYFKDLANYISDTANEYKVSVDNSMRTVECLKLAKYLSDELITGVQAEVGRHHVQIFEEAKKTIEELVDYIRVHNIPMLWNDSETIAHLLEILGERPTYGQREALVEANRGFVSFVYRNTEIPRLWSNWLIACLSLTL